MITYSKLVKKVTKSVVGEINDVLAKIGE